MPTFTLPQLEAVGSSYTLNRWKYDKLTWLEAAEKGDQFDSWLKGISKTNAGAYVQLLRTWLARLREVQASTESSMATTDADVPELGLQSVPREAGWGSGRLRLHRAELPVHIEHALLHIGD